MFASLFQQQIHVLRNNFVILKIVFLTWFNLDSIPIYTEMVALERTTDGKFSRKKYMSLASLATFADGELKARYFRKRKKNLSLCFSTFCKFTTGCISAEFLVWPHESRLFWHFFPPLSNCRRLSLCFGGGNEFRVVWRWNPATTFLRKAKVVSVFGSNRVFDTVRLDLVENKEMRKLATKLF